MITRQKDICRLFLIILLHAYFSMQAGIAKASSSLKFPEFFKSPDELEQIINNDHGDVLIIDIRPQICFEKKSIISSINIPGILLKRKTFLKKKKLVLVDEGIDYCTVKKIGHDLIKHGFSNVYALEGGIRYFQHKNKKLQIIEDSLEARYGLDVVYLQKVLHCKEQSPVLIDIRNKETFEKEKIEGSIWFDYKLENKTGNKEIIKKAQDELFRFIENELKNRVHMSKKIKKDKENPPLTNLNNETRHPVILIDSKGKQSPRLARIFSRRGINVFYLIGGMESWDLYIHEIPAAKRKEYLKKDSGCKECN